MLCEYSNSWLFTPIVLGVLPDKYIPNEIQTPYGFKKSIIGFDSNDIWAKTNDKINNCDNFPDRVCWELSNQQIFCTKDKTSIANEIRKFVEQNKRFNVSSEDNIGSLEREHIIERFNEIANDVEELDEDEFPYFVLKNTSCDDNVEFWFKEYDEESNEYKEKSIKDWGEHLAEFVIIENEKIVKFISNKDYKF